MNKFFIRRVNFKFYNDKNLVKNINTLLFLSKRLDYTLTMLALFKLTIFGVNCKYFIKNVCIKKGFSMFSIVQFIKIGLILDLQSFFRKAFVNYELMNFINSRLSLKTSLKLYNGKRYLMRLPSRGQRSKTNAQTAKKRQLFFFDL